MYKIMFICIAKHYFTSNEIQESYEAQLPLVDKRLISSYERIKLQYNETLDIS